MQYCTEKIELKSNLRKSGAALKLFKFHILHVALCCKPGIVIKIKQAFLNAKYLTTKISLYVKHNL